jgi:hypothetical protein
MSASGADKIGMRRRASGVKGQRCFFGGALRKKAIKSVGRERRAEAEAERDFLCAPTHKPRRTLRAAAGCSRRTHKQRQTHVKQEADRSAPTQRQNNSLLPTCQLPTPTNNYCQKLQSFLFTTKQLHFLK